MLFSSLTFLWFFLPAAVAVYLLAPGRTGKNAVLLAASLIFYSWGEPRGLILLLATVILCYITGRLLLSLDEGTEGASVMGSLSHNKRMTGPGARKAVLLAGLLIQLGLLCYFKYFNMIAGAVNDLTGQSLIPPMKILLPLGISFYTFQALSYMIDVYGRKAAAQKNLFHLALYLCLFPQLLSGPIIKYHEIAGAITERMESLSMTAYGIKRFSYGLAKKVLFANTFGQAADRIFSLPSEQLGTLTVWLAVILYTMQIYYDFSGYSDMAIGLGRIFGFRYAENFNYPYLSASITEFWRRWHISLSTWFRDYLYIPLGGNRKGLTRTCVNLLIVFFATGLWHGASFNFVIWGLYYGFFLILERLWLTGFFKKHPLPVLSHAYALLVVIFGWLLFRTETLASARTLLHVMIIPSRGLWDPRIFAGGNVLFLLFLSILLCGPLQMLFPGLKARLYDEDQIRIWEIPVMALLIGLSVTAIVSGTYSAFIYFKF